MSEQSEDRIIRNMGSVNLVVEPHADEPGRFLAVAELLSGERHRMALNVSPDGASNLAFDAAGMHFDNLNDAGSWLLRRAAELDASLRTA